ncbi:TolC family protein [candidate division CSSED10-310 bacterium]|uniref:TolC family protein n=1 Tax=candidate division CSSED10-310 bacterium TaxID=2855610 RepID=A0ABV6YXA7_UNCC1
MWNKLHLVYVLLMVFTSVNPAYSQDEKVLKLEQAIELSLNFHPGVQAYQELIKGHDALVEQSKLLPNPELEIETENLGFIETELTVHQLIELGGKRAARINIAQQEKDLSIIDLKIKKLEIIADVTTRFLDVQESQQKIKLIDDALSLAENILSSVKKRVNAGATLAVEETRAQVALTLTQIQRNKLLLDHEAKKKALALLWGERGNDVELVAEELNIESTLPDYEILFSALSKSPEFISQAARVNMRLLELQAERAGGVPDITVAGGYLRNSELNENAAIVNISIPLQFFNRNQGNIAFSQANIKVSNLEKQAAMAGVETELNELYFQLQAFHREIIIINEEAMPRAVNAFEEIEKLFARGKMSFFGLLDSRQSLIDMQNSLIEAQIAFLKTKAELEKLIGISFNQLMMNGAEKNEP